MAFPPGWAAEAGKGLPFTSGRRSLRFFVRGTATAEFSDRAYNFAAQAGAFTIPRSPVVAPGSAGSSGFPATVGVGTPMGGQAGLPAAQATPVTTQASHSIRVSNEGASELEFSFDGVTVHGALLAGEKVVYLDRYETGIAVRGDGMAFRIEAW